MPTIDARTEDEMLVIIEDIPEDEDGEEDAVCSCRSSPSSLSALAPFFPICRSAGRSKFRRWDEDPDMGSSDDEPTCSSYLDVACKAL